jgi:hypothetical protein
MKKIKIMVGISVVLFALLYIGIYSEPALGFFDFDFEFEFLENVSKIEKKGNETYSSITANLALLFIIIGISYPLTKFLMRGTAASERDLREKLSVFLSVHIISCMFAFIFSIAHAHYAGATSIFLILSVVAMGCLVIAGCIMRYVPNLDTAQRESITQVKKIFFWSFLFLVILGHLLAME